MKRNIIFTKDFAAFEKNDLHECDGQLASHLVRIDKVAKFADEDGNAIADPADTAPEEVVEVKKNETTEDNGENTGDGSILGNFFGSKNKNKNKK